MYCRFIPFVLALTLLVACSGAPATSAPLPGQPLPTSTPGGPTPTIAVMRPPSTANPSSEVLRISGSGNSQSESFSLDAPTPLRLSWKETSTDRFQVYIVSLDPAQSDPRYQKVSMALAAAPSEGFTDYVFAPGQYQVVVESSSGDWEVWVELLVP